MADTTEYAVPDWPAIHAKFVDTEGRVRFGESDHLADASVTVTVELIDRIVKWVQEEDADPESTQLMFLRDELQAWVEIAMTYLQIDHKGNPVNSLSTSGWLTVNPENHPQA